MSKYRFIWKRGVSGAGLMLYKLELGNGIKFRFPWEFKDITVGEVFKHPVTGRWFGRIEKGQSVGEREFLTQSEAKRFVEQKCGQSRNFYEAQLVAV